MNAPKTEKSPPGSGKQQNKKPDMTQDMKRMMTTKRQDMKMYCVRKMRALLSLSFLLLMLGLGGIEAWGQTPPVEITTDADGNGTIEDSEKKLYLIQTNAFPSFYIAPQANNTITTNNILGDYMLWYFLDAGSVGDTQYYYIVNNSTGKYIYNHNGNSRGISIITSTTFESLTNANKEKCKFKIVSNGIFGTTDIYNIDVKANQTYYGLNKQNGSQANNNPIRLTNTDYINDTNSTWKFIRFNGNYVWPTPPFTPSTDSDKHFYKILNAKDNTFYVSTDYIPNDLTKGKVTYASASNPTDLMVWYLKEAPTDSSEPWFKYYYIINPSAEGRYMYYSGTATDGTNQSDAVSVKAYDSNDEDRYQFVVIQAAKGDGAKRVTCYAIIPKLLKGTLWGSNSIGSTSISDGANMGIISSRGAENTAQWQFVSTNFSTDCARPDITFSNATGKVTITTATSNPSIYYTTDGTTPSSTNGTLYSAPFDVTEQTTIKAIVTRTGFTDSEVKTVTFYKVATPTIQDNGNHAVSITSETQGATIYYTTDGSDPTTSSTPYTVPLTENISGVGINAIAVKDGWINSTIGSGTVTLQCAKPVITKSGNNVTITCNSPSTADIYYTKNGGEPSSSSTPYSGAIPVEIGDVIKAIAIASGYDNSPIATKNIHDNLTPTDGKYLINSQSDFEIFLDMANEEDGASNHYVLKTNVNAGSPISQPFTGTFDGGLHTISNLGHALFNTIDGGTVKNVILDNVVISSGTNVGAICNEARGDTRIYNCGVLATNSTVAKDEKGYDKITSCSSTISGGGYVGGIVGLLDGSSRVINCFSYANITGGSSVGGIVGYNNGTTTANNLKTMVMNCMFYGDITGGSNKAPIYNGEIISNVGNTGVSNFNYFCAEASYVKDKNIDTYNCALLAETRYLQRFEFFRHILNGHRELAAWWATGDAGNKDEMMKWVLEPSQIGTTTPYPILKTPGKYPSVVNIDAANATTQTERNKGGKLGTLTVNIEMGSGNALFNPTKPSDAEITTNQLTLNITDKDPNHFNFNYGKVQLPYYNDVGTKNYTSNRVVTGWKITSITPDGSVSYNSFTTGTDASANANGEITAAPYNFADRRSIEKDLFSKSGRVFNQGAYWDVPEGVTAITIQPYWAQAVYCADSYRDVVYDQDMATPSYIGNVGGGLLFNNSDEIEINGDSQQVYNTISGAQGALAIQGGVYDNAIVLVGNVHQIGLSSDSKSKPYTIMSADLDKDNEPDYSYILRFDGRCESHPVRVDFLNIPGLGMAQKSTGGKGTYNFGIMIPKGWFESTNTSLFRFTQFEYEHGDRTVNDPLILQGGVMEQWVSFNLKKISHKTPYFHVGGNVWFKEFHRGTHQDRQQNTSHPPVSVTGGDFDEFYLTGLYRADFANYEDNLECYINGGRFGIVAGAAQEGVGKASDHTKGNVVWQIQNADIKEFYGGGLNAVHPVEGNITTVIEGGYIKQFCGGPKFGDMSTGKTVKTTATNCKFDTFYGAGYGGNSYSRFTPSNINNISGDYTGWNTFLTDNYKQEYNSTYGGVSVTYFTQYIPMSNNKENVARLLIDFVSFSLATTRNVTSKLTGCTITGNFYGGGNLGKVEGPVSSTLTNCTVEGNVYGAGYSASKPKVDVIKAGNFDKPPYYDEDLGVYFDPTFPDTDEYTWEHKDGTINSTDEAIDKTNHILYTNLDLSETNLGSVSGAVTLTITTNGENETTTIGTAGNSATGNVYGGGELSTVNNNDKPTDAHTTVIIKGKTTVLGNVYGGGNKGIVSGSATVNIEE